MKKIIDWIKQNKLAALLILVVVYFILKNQIGVFPTFNSLSSSSYRSSQVSDYGVSRGSLNSISAPSAMMEKSMAYDSYLPEPEIAPSTGSQRMVVSTSYLSLLVKDVRETMNQIKSYTEGLGGYFVNSNIDRPEEGASGTLTLRIPSLKLDEALTKLRGFSVKIISENLEGTDVTDQYVDNNARLVILNKNKARFEEIMQEAKNVDEILRVQTQIFNLQSQIDSIKGQQQYLEKTAEMAKITIYLSTDELSLPYAPENSWRPSVIFKRALRSLVGTLRGVGSFVIWFGVYLVIIIPAAIIILLVRKMIKKRNQLL